MGLNGAPFTVDTFNRLVDAGSKQQIRGVWCGVGDLLSGTYRGLLL